MDCKFEATQLYTFEFFFTLNETNGYNNVHLFLKIIFKYKISQFSLSKIFTDNLV